MSASLNNSPNQAAQRPSKIKRMLRALPLLGAGIVVAIAVSQVAWQLSGDNQWHLEMEQNGVQVYSLKSPGNYNKQFKAVMKAQYSLNHLVAGLIENSTPENCKKNIPGCMEVKIIEPWNSKIMSDTVLWKLELPPPFSPREMILRSQVSQDPTTKTVTVDIMGAPNAAPRNSDAVRLTELHNRWIYKPLGGGQVEITFVQNMDMGGLFPRMLLNLGGAEETFNFIHDQLPKLLDREPLRKAKYDFISEI